MTAEKAPPLFYLDSIRMGNAPAAGELELFAGSPELTVVYKSDGGRVRGTLESCNSNLVVLAPQDAPGLPVFTGTCGPDGRYEIDSVRPGDYSAVALPGLRLWEGDVDPALLRNAIRITVRAGETTQADLPLSRAQ